jgi:hypothetical protein
MARPSRGQSRAIGRMLSLLSMAALVLAAFLDWLGRGVRPARVPLRDLVQGISFTGSGGAGKAAAFTSSMAVPLLAAALLALLACVFASRTLAWLSFIVALATTALWTVLTAVYRADHNGQFTSRDWHVGYWAVLVGLLLGLMAAAIPWRRPGT